MQIGIIGGGVMGEALIGGILGMGLTPADQIIVSEPIAHRREALIAQHGVRATASNRDAASGADVLILAIKPQSAGHVFKELHGQLKGEQLVFSIMAGVMVRTMREGLDHGAIIRVMPNTPAQVGYGMSVWYATPDVTAEQRDVARQLLQAVGKEVEVAEEKYLDMATALSGSGPAYVALFIEALIDAGVHIGLPRAMAHQLVMQTVLGSAVFAEKSGHHPAELRNMVTSPGGTTTESLLRLEEGRFRALLTQAVIAGYEKSRLLGGETGK